jgi:hypothetical protein
MADLDTSLSMLQESVQALHDANIAAEAVGAIADSAPSSEASYNEAGLSEYDEHYDTLSLCESAEVKLSKLRYNVGYAPLLAGSTDSTTQ